MQKIIFFLRLIIFNQESAYSRVQHLLVFEVSGQLPHTKNKQNISQVPNQKYENIWSDFESENMWSHIVWDAKLKFAYGF